MDLNLTVTAKQKQFIKATADEVLFGGAAGGGKSRGQLTDALLYALKYPGSKQLILRRTFPDLERSLIREHLSFYPLKGKIYTYNSSTHRGQFKNGSTLDFGYLDSEMDVYQYQGAEYDTIRFDELTQFTEYMYLYLISRLRGVNDYPKQVKSSANPGGIGHSWVKARFIDIGPPDEVHSVTDQQSGTQSTRLFIPSRVTDNSALMQSDPDYIKRLERLPEKERRALLYGDWDLFEGQFFSEFRREVHVCEPFPIPAHWRRYVVIDYGMDMLAGLWIAVNEQGRAWAYREVYEGRDNGKGKDGKGHIVRDAAARLKALTPADEQIYCWLAPPDLWGRNKDTGKSTAEIFAESGIYFEKASASRVDGWRAVHEWLALNKDEQGNMVPGLMIFSTCTNLIRTLPAVQFDPKNSEDVANEPHELTHAPDALRYFCASWTSPAEQQKEEKKTILDYFTDDDQQGDPLGWGDEIHVI